jgi:hypothetical protein
MLCCRNSEKPLIVSCLCDAAAEGHGRKPKMDDSDRKRLQGSMARAERMQSAFGDTLSVQRRGKKYENEGRG